MVGCRARPTPTEHEPTFRMELPSQEASVRLNHWILDTMLWRYCIILFARLVTNLFNARATPINRKHDKKETHNQLPY